MHHALVVNVINYLQLMVIHNNGEKVEEELVTIDSSYITVEDYECVYSGIEAIERARTRLGDGYNVLSDNCEHLVTWARTGTAESKQVKGAQTAIAVLKGAATGAAVARQRCSCVGYRCRRSRWWYGGVIQDKEIILKYMHILV